MLVAFGSQVKGDQGRGDTPIGREMRPCRPFSDNGRLGLRVLFRAVLCRSCLSASADFSIDKTLDKPVLTCGRIFAAVFTVISGNGVFRGAPLTTASVRDRRSLKSLSPGRTGGVRRERRGRCSRSSRSCDSSIRAHSPSALVPTRRSQWPNSAARTPAPTGRQRSRRHPRRER